MSFFVECPHCACQVEIVAVNCAIFRHGIYKESGQQVNPHAPKSECDRLSEQNLIYGCGKAFRLIQQNNEYKAVICDYI